MHVYDPMSSLGRTVWRFLLRRAAGRYATHDLSHEMVAPAHSTGFGTVSGSLDSASGFIAN